MLIGTEDAMKRNKDQGWAYLCSLPLEDGGTVVCWMEAKQKASSGGEFEWTRSYTMVRNMT